MILSSINWNSFFVKADEIVILPKIDLQDRENIQREIYENKNLDPSLVAIDYEVISKRTENEKHFRKTDGTYEVAIYGEPIHFLENGEWKDIDNSLFDNGNELENKANHFKVKFPKTIDDNKKLKMTLDEYNIDWRILDIDTSNIYYDDTNLESNNIKELVNVNQSVLYSNIQNNVDIEYIVTGSKVKENIILNEYIKDFSLSFEYDLKGLMINEDKDGKLVFVNDDNEIIFTFDDLYMVDSNFNYSKDVEITYEQIKSKEYRIIITPNDEWLKTAAFPIKIDPTIQIVHDVTKYFVEDKYVFGTDGDEYEQSYLKIGYNGTYKYRSYIYFTIQDVPDTSFITYAHINYLKIQSTITGTVQVKEVEYSTKQQYYDIKGEGLDITYDTIVDYVNLYSSSQELLNFDVTNVVKQWHQDDQDSGIFELSTLDETVVENHICTSAEGNINITLPTVIIGYADLVGMKNYWTYQSYSADNAGTLLVSDYTGKVTVSRQDVIFSNEKQSFDLSMVYDQSRYNKDYGYGAGWLTNYNILLDVSNPNIPTITDASGATSNFYKSSLCPDPDKAWAYSCYISDNGSNDYLIHHEIEHLDWEEWFYTPQLGIEYRFNSNGSLKNITNNINQSDYTNNDMILFEYVTGSTTKISEIKLCNDVVDVNGACNHNRVSFNYTNGLLDTLELELKQGDGTYNTIEKNDYNYVYESSIGKYVLNNVEYSNKYKDSTYSLVGGGSYDYNQDGFLEQLYDNFGVNVNILFDTNNSVDNVNISNEINKIEDFDYSYGSDRTTITVHNGDYIKMCFDVYGHTIQTYNNKGFVESKEYYNQSNPYFTHRLASHTPLTFVDNDKNIVVNPSFEVDTSGWTMNGNTTVTYSMFKDLYYSNFIGSKGVKIDGNINQTKSIERYITDETVLSQINKNMTLSGWIRIENGSPSDTVQIIVTAYKTMSTPTPVILSFDPKVDIWQFKTQDIVLEEDPESVKIELIYKGIGTVYFDNIQISPNVSTQYFDYDEDNRTLTNVYVNNESLTEIEYLYDRFNRVIEVLEHSYDENGTLITREITKKEFDETDSLKLSSSTQKNVKTVYTYNSNGQVTNVQVGDSTTNFSLGAGFDTLYNQYISSTTDDFGKTTSYVYDELTGLLQTLQNPKGNTFEYVYNNSGNLEKVINGDSNVIYNYDEDNRLETITLENGTIYRITYDSMDRIDTISIDGLTNPLIDYSYKTDGDYITGLIETKKYANDDIFKYVYNSDNLVEYVQFKDALGVYENKFYYEYDNYDRVKLMKTYIGGTVFLTENFTYNSQGLLEKITDDNGNSINYGYDTIGNLTSISFDVNDTVSTTKYFYNKRLTVSESSDDDIYSSLYDRTEFTTQTDDSVVKQFNYETSALYRLDNVNLILNYKDSINANLSISQNVNYFDSTLRIKSYEFVITYTAENNSTTTNNYKYEYLYECAKQSLVISKGASPLLVKFSQQLITVVLHV